MKILIAPDKFKGSLSAREVAEIIANGLRDVLPDATIDIVPVADGGEGTAEVICDALHGAWVNCKGHDPIDREIEARYAFVEPPKLAVMEMSEAAGMQRLKPEEYNVDLANTFGVGEMILDAAQRGAREIIIGLGGSATNDGGFGMARALGFQFLDERNKEIKKVVDLAALERIEAPRNLSLPKITAAADVRNPLLGKNGATSVFGPQKGVTQDKIDAFEQALTKLANGVARDLHLDLRNEPGAGAAGGVGFGLMSFCGAKIRPGFDVVAEAIDLESKMKDVDLVITGEGSLDRQTLEGKAPAGVAQLARKLGKRVFAIVGRASEDRPAREIFDDVYELGGSIPEAPELLRKKACELAVNYLE
jgi:glycerate kinase